MTERTTYGLSPIESATVKFHNVSPDFRIRLADVRDVTMRIVAMPPPNLFEIIRVFPAATKKGVLFAYGDTIYNPDDVDIPLQLLAHESVHGAQQRTWRHPKDWWEGYLSDKAFRFEQELEAHRVELESYCADVAGGRTSRRRYTAAVAERLSGELYGRMTTKANAMMLLKEKV